MADDGDGGGEPKTREELIRLIAGAVRVHLPDVDEATARAIADTALRALAARMRPDRAGGGAGRRRHPTWGGWPWWAVGGALLVVAGATVAGLLLARAMR